MSRAGTAAHAPDGSATRRFWARLALALLSVAAWTAIGLWLKAEADWPGGYGFRCRGRGCWFAEMWHSPALLGSPGPEQIGLFVWIWSIPAFVVGALIHRRVRKRHARTFS